MSEIEIIREGALTRVLMNRPEKKNALNVGMYTTMAGVIEDAGRDMATGAILIEGTGGDFTAGNDIEDFIQAPPRDETAPAFRFLLALARTDVPVAAAVNGAAVGVGATMLLHCDCVVAAPEARLAMPFTDLALVPEAGSSLLLTRMLGQARAARLLMASQAIDGQSALELGIVTELCPAERLAETASGRARALAEKPVAAMRATKALMKPDRDSTIAHMRMEIKAFARALASDDCQQRIKAFLAR